MEHTPLPPLNEGLETPEWMRQTRLSHALSEPCVLWAPHHVTCGWGWGSGWEEVPSCLLRGGEGTGYRASGSRGAHQNHFSSWCKCSQSTGKEIWNQAHDLLQVLSCGSLDC